MLKDFLILWVRWDIGFLIKGHGDCIAPYGTSHSSGCCRGENFAWLKPLRPAWIAAGTSHTVPWFIAMTQHRAARF